MTIMQNLLFIISLLTFSIINSHWNDAQNNPQFYISHQGLNFQPSLDKNKSQNFQFFNSQSSSQISPSFVISSLSTKQKTNFHDETYSLLYADGHKEIFNQATFDKELQKVTEQYVESAQNYFGTHLEHITPMIQQALLTGTINTPEMQNKLLKQIINYLVTTNQTNKGILAAYTNHPWLVGKDFSNLLHDEKIIVNYAIARIAYCQEPATIELAQACLQNIDNYQQTGSTRILSSAQNYYNALQSHISSTYSTKKFDTKIIQKDLVTILNTCSTSIDTIEKQALKNDEQQQKYLNKLYEREVVLTKTLQNHLSAITITNVNFALPANVSGYLMAHNINYASFYNQDCIYFQHLLTSQIIELLTTNVDLANQNIQNDILANYINHTCNLAVAAQQLNQEYQIAQATLLTDLSEIATIIGESTSQIMVDLALGIGKGSLRSLQSWLTLACNLCVSPITTVQKGINILYQSAQFFGDLNKIISHCIPHTNMSNFQNILTNFKDENDLTNKLELSPIFTPLPEQYESLKTNITIAIDYSIPLIENILARPAQENIADVTQCIVDGIITNKIGQAIFSIANFGKTYLTQATQAISEALPTEFIHEPLYFATTPTGDIVAYMENTGEFIKNTTQTIRSALNHTALSTAQYAAHAKNLSDYIQKTTNADQEKIKKLETMFEKYYRGDLLLPGIDKIEGVKQIDAYRTITNNFQDISKLTQADIMYLNMCNGLYPHSVEINKLVKKSMLYITDLEGNVTHIKEFDIFHSFLGEMRPNATSYAKKGGHMLFPQSKITTHNINAIIPLQHGYFDLAVKHITDKGQTVWKTQFPYGLTPTENAQLIIDLIKEIQHPIEVTLGKNGNQGFELKSKFNQYFQVFVQNEIVQFYPISSNK